MLTIIKSLTDIAIIDCTSFHGNNLLSEIAVEQADSIIRLVTPDLKSMSFFSSQLPIYADLKYKTDQHVIGLNITEKDVFAPIMEIKTYFKEISFTLPYCREVKEQYFNGELLKPIIDRKFNKVLKMIAGKVK